HGPQRIPGRGDRRGARDRRPGTRRPGEGRPGGDRTDRRVGRRRPDAGGPDMSEFPAPMADPAFIGPLGEAVLALEETSEPCREALLFELLVFFGSAVGRTAYFPVGRSRHYANEYGLLVGATSRARKGTVRDIAVDIIGAADPIWAQDG